MLPRLSAHWAGLPASSRGIVFMLLSTLFFSAMHVLIRQLSMMSDLHPFQIAFFRNFFGLVVFLPLFMRVGLAPLRTQRFPLHALRAVMNVIAMFAFFTALTLTPVAQVTALGFTAPIFAALLGYFVLGEVFCLRRWAAIAIGFLGTLVILRPGFATVDTGSLLTLFSALLWGCTLIVIRILGRTESSITITSYMNILLAVLSLVPAILAWRTPDAVAWLMLLAIGVLGTVAQILIAESLKEADTGVVMPFDFCKLLWVAVLGYLLFGEVPGPFVWFGAVMIFGSATYIAYRENKRAKSSKACRRADQARPDGPGG